MKDQLIQIGKIGRAHGRFGEVRVWLFNNNYHFLHPDATLYLNNDRSQIITVESARPADKFFLVRFEGYHYRDQVHDLTHKTLSVDRCAMPPTDEDEYYCADLVGFDVVAQPSDPEELVTIGRVEGFLDHVETEVMIVDGPRLHKRWLVPFIQTVVLRVDLQQKTITLAPLDQWTHEDQVLDQ